LCYRLCLITVKITRKLKTSITQGINKTRQD